MPPITTISRTVDHDLEAQRRCRARCSAARARACAPASVANSADSTLARGAVHHHAVADRLGAELVLADGLQHAAKGRVHDAQQRQHQHHGGDEQQVVADQIAVDRSRRGRALERLEARAISHLGQFLKVRPSSPPVKSDSCEASVWNAEATASVIIAKKIARTRSENRPMASDSTSETASERAAHAHQHQRPRSGPRRVAGDGNAVGADAEEHGVREAHDAGVAQQQVEAGDQHHEDQHLGRHRQRLDAREEARARRRASATSSTSRRHGA